MSYNATLTIDPGVRFVFSAGINFTIEDDGLLIAAGTQAAPITFTAATQAPGYWDGITISSIATAPSAAGIDGAGAYDQPPGCSVIYRIVIGPSRDAKLQ
ncbi:MAG: hypothetical protein P8166_08580 [Candidatus Thiodiazotropha sp.]